MKEIENIEIFLNRLHKISNELEALMWDFQEDFYKQYNGNDFETQALAAGRLYDLILEATHESSSNINFCINEIKELGDFINFRRENKKLNDSELEIIIDNQKIDLDIKLDLAKRLTMGDKKLLLSEIKKIKNSWNNLFKNQGYQKIRDKYHLKK